VVEGIDILPVTSFRGLVEALAGEGLSPFTATAEPTAAPTVDAVDFSCVRWPGRRQTRPGHGAGRQSQRPYDGSVPRAGKPGPLDPSGPIVLPNSTGRDRFMRLAGREESRWSNQSS
jgi:hypothetical protein